MSNGTHMANGRLHDIKAIRDEYIAFSKFDSCSAMPNPNKVIKHAAMGPNTAIASKTERKY